MKKNFYQYITCIAFIASGLCISTNVFAQVTVGSKGIPNQGALLDMKQEDKADGSANSKKGLGLPRVALTAVDKLDPCVATTGIAATDDAAKKSHIGLTVYNTTDNTAGAATLSEGVYAWDGAMWTQYSGTTAGGAENGLSMSGKKVILGGPLNRPTTITGDATNNLTLNTPTSVGSTLGVTGATTLGSTLGVSGVTSLRNTNVTGNLTVSGNTKTATSTVTGNETVGGTLVVTGATTTKATNVTGVMKYTNTTPVVGQYLSATATDGTVAWTTLPALPSTATNTEPWRVQGGMAEATQPTDATFVTGDVAIGSNTSGGNKLQVTGNTNIIGNSVVSGNSKTATSTVTGNESVGGSATIGMNTTTPTVGALLEIRNKQQDLTGVADVLDPKMVTSDKGGLLLPRVKLVNLASLEPFITGADAKTKLSLAGLMVYNIAVSGDKIYPAFYVWSGTSWETPQQSASTLVIDNSVGVKTKAFTFYELGTETTTSTPVKYEPLKVTVSGAFGTPTYQWYQVTGNNVHVRTGSKIIGATSSEFYPVDGVTFNANGDITSSVSVLKGTTRNANNTGFYRYYCVVSDAYRTVETETVEVAVGCGAKTNSGEWISFMCYNLGAGLGTPGSTTFKGISIDEQMNTSLPAFTLSGSESVHSFVIGEDAIVGGLFQWGRIADGHEKRNSEMLLISNLTTSNYANGKKCLAAQSVGFPYAQIKANDPNVGKYITGNSTVSPQWNWVLGVNQANLDAMWNTLPNTQNDPCTHILEDGSYIDFWNGVAVSDTDVSSSGAICSGSQTGWKLPTLEEFGLIFKGGTLSGLTNTATANTWFWQINDQVTNTNMTKIRGYLIKPDNKTSTLFLPANGYRQNYLPDNTSLVYLNMSGYYWTKNILGTNASIFKFNSNSTDFNVSTVRMRGQGIRCIKNN